MYHSFKFSFPLKIKSCLWSRDIYDPVYICICQPKLLWTEWYPVSDQTIICNLQSKQGWCTQHLHSEVEQIYIQYRPTVFSVWNGISTIIIFHFPSHLSHIIHLVFIIDCLFQPLTTLVWFTLGWISTFGRKRRGVTLNHSQPWMKCSWCESSMSAAMTAACLIGPSPPCWHDMMGDDTQQQHIWLRC